jgi:energy-coupling factor transporter transmembrane protein EcfT
MIDVSVSLIVVVVVVFMVVVVVSMILFLVVSMVVVVVVVSMIVFLVPSIVVVVVVLISIIVVVVLILNQPPKITWFSGTDLKSGDVTYEIWRLEVNCMREQNYDKEAMLIAGKNLQWEKQEWGLCELI